MRLVAFSRKCFPRRYCMTSELVARRRYLTTNLKASTSRRRQTLARRNPGSDTEPAPAIDAPHHQRETHKRRSSEMLAKIAKNLVGSMDIPQKNNSSVYHSAARTQGANPS